MNTNQPSPFKRTVQTTSGRIAHTEQGTGPVALFVHGVPLNGHLWRHQLAHLSDAPLHRVICSRMATRRSVQIKTCPSPRMPACSQSFSMRYRLSRSTGGQRQRRRYRTDLRRVASGTRSSLTLTDCDAHDNWPPDAFKPFLAMAANGGLSATLNAMLSDKNVYRSPQALAPAYEHPDRVTDDSIEIYLRPLVRTEQRTRDFQRFLAAFDNKHTLAIEARLKTLNVPTLIGNGRCLFRCEVVAVAG